MDIGLSKRSKKYVKYLMNFITQAINGFLICSESVIYGLLLTYGLATRHACYAPATRPLLAVDLHVWFSQDEEVFTQQVK